MTARIVRVCGGLFAAFSSALALACSPSADSHSIDRTLGGGIVARVGPEPISSTFVARIASTRQWSPRDAGERAVADALFAEAARERFATTGLIEVSERAVLARMLLEQLLDEARAAGPPTDAELERLRAERWMDLDRPVSVRTHHAVVMPENADQDAAAREAAERIAAATSGVSELEAFLKTADSVDTGQLKTRVESLPLMTEDGRAVYLDPLDHRRKKPPSFDRDYARAAHAIAGEGQTSPVVRTKFGYHVIFLTERVDAQRYELAALRSKLTDDVHHARARQQLDSLLERLKRDTRIEIARNADQLSARVSEQR